ncbi:unnamed protein product [Chrysoparadoxa australica]
MWYVTTRLVLTSANYRTLEDIGLWEVCLKNAAGVCQTNGLLQFWMGNFDLYQAQVRTDADLLAAVSAPTFLDGSPVNRDVVMGVTTVDAAGNVLAAEGYGCGIALQDGQESQDWMALFQDTMAVELPKLQGQEGFYFTSRSIDDELARAVSGEIVLVASSYFFMILFVTSALGTCDLVKSRRGLAGAGVTIIMLAGLGAYGFCSGLNVPFTALAQVLPFVLLGIGVDDMFIITAALDSTDPTKGIEERIGQALARCGVSVTYTSLTDFTAFMLGSWTSLPAVKYFCIYAAVAILFDYMLQVTAFVAVLSLDAERQAAGIRDFPLCLNGPRELKQEQEQDQEQVGEVGPTQREQRSSKTQEHQTGAGATATAEGHEFHNHADSKLSRFMRDTYTPFILKPASKVCILSLAAALAAVSTWGITKLNTAFELVDLTPPDSFARAYIEMARDKGLFIFDSTVPVDIYFDKLEYTSLEVQQEIERIQQAAVLEEFTEGPVDSWLSDFRMYKAGGGYYVDQGTFPADLAEFLSQPQFARHVANLVFSDDRQSILFSRVSMFHTGTQGVIDEVNAMQDLRAVAASGDVLVPDPFAYGEAHLLYEMFAVLYREIVVNFSLVLLAVFSLSLLVLGSIRYTMLATFLVMVIDLEILASLVMWNIDLNAISAIELIMAVGLVVDYVVHILHYFLKQPKQLPTVTRVRDAMGEIGPSVLLGVSTTFLGMVPMSLARSAIFETFFKMFLAIVALASFHGLVLLPVLLSFLPSGENKEVSPDFEVKKLAREDAPIDLSPPVTVL